MKTFFCIMNSCRVVIFKSEAINGKSGMPCPGCGQQSNREAE